MTTASIIIDGNSWTINGNVTDSYLPYTNEVVAGRDGRSFPVTTAKPRMLTVDAILVAVDDRDAFEQFFRDCGNSRFTVTVILGNDSCDDQKKYDYLNCLVVGEQSHSLFESQITGFQCSYDTRNVR